MIQTTLTPETATPEPPASPSIAAGLTIVGVAALAMVATLPGRTFGLGLVTEQLLRDLRLDEVTFGRVNLGATLVGALFCFPAGKLLDRYGPRAVLTALLAAMGLTVVAMGRAESLAQLTVVVTLSRGFGQSALSVVSISLLGKAFDRRLTWPTATYAVLMTLGFILAFQTVGYCVHRPDVGWRAAWTGLGAALLAAAPVTWLALGRTRLRTSPADAQALAVCPAADDGFTLSEALATPAFYVFAAATALFGLASSGLLLFNFGVLKERGLTYENFLAMQAISTPFGLLGQGCCGRLGRGGFFQGPTAAALVLYAVGLVGLTQITGFAGLTVCAVALGIAGGMITVIFFAVWNRMFGSRELGRIQGAAQMTTVFASAVGPLLFAEVRVRFDSYSPALFGLAAVIVLCAVVVCVTPQPRRVATPAATEPAGVA